MINIYIHIYINISHKYMKYGQSYRCWNNKFLNTFISIILSALQHNYLTEIIIFYKLIFIN